MAKFTLPALALAALMTTTACENLDAIGMKQGLGTLGGAAAGGLLGSQIGGGTGKMVAVGAGTILGALAGGEIGKSLDRADKLAADEALQEAASTSTGRAIRWENPRTGNRGTITPRSSARRSSAGYCREYEQTIYVGGRAETATGRACQQRNGKWKLVS